MCRRCSNGLGSRRTCRRCCRLSFCALLVPLPLLDRPSRARRRASLAVLALVLARRAVAILRALALGLVLLALANPSLVQEEREQVKDIVAVVVDRSDLADRSATAPRMTERVRAELQRRFGALADFEPRFIEADDGDGRRRHAAVRGARQRPRRRAAGPPRRRRHDHRRRRARHPGHRRRPRLPRAAARAVTGRPNERDRQIKLVEAPRFGIVGKRPDDPRRGHGARRHRLGRAHGAPRRPGLRCARRCAPAQPFAIQVRIEHGGPNVVELEVDGAAGRADAGQQPRRRHRSRASARSCACCSSPASRMPASAPGATC